MPRNSSNPPVPFLHHEQTRYKPLHRLGDHHRPRLRYRLDPRRNIRRVAEDVGVFADARTHHHRTRINANPRGKVCCHAFLVELRYGLEDRQSRPSGSLGVVVVGLGPTEVGHNTVVEILGDVAAITGYRFGRGAVIAGHRVAPLFGIEPRGNFG